MTAPDEGNLNKKWCQKIEMDESRQKAISFCAILKAFKADEKLTEFHRIPNIEKLFKIIIRYDFTYIHYKSKKIFHINPMSFLAAEKAFIIRKSNVFKFLKDNGLELPHVSLRPNRQGVGFLDRRWINHVDFSDIQLLLFEGLLLNMQDPDFNRSANTFPDTKLSRYATSRNLRKLIRSRTIRINYNGPYDWKFVIVKKTAKFEGSVFAAAWM